MTVLTVQEFEGFMQSSDLGDRAVRQKVSGIVIDHVVAERNAVKRWDVQGCAPLCVDGAEYLRPCPKPVFGASGWVVTFENRWFCD